MKAAKDKPEIVTNNGKPVSVILPIAIPAVLRGATVMSAMTFLRVS